MTLRKLRDEARRLLDHDMAMWLRVHALCIETEVFRLWMNTYSLLGTHGIESQPLLILQVGEEPENPALASAPT
jgi:hypothetical protein